MTDIVRELFTVTRGDDWELPVTEYIGSVSGDRRDLTGCSFEGRIWWVDPATAQKTGFDTEAAVVDASEGTWLMRVDRTSDDQPNVPEGVGAFWDGAVTDANDVRLTEFSIPLRVRVGG